MAGDWIKMRADLLDDPAVIGIATAVGMDEFAVVGRLQSIWSWADRQSRDGHAPSVTSAWIDRKLACDGFAQAMCNVGWLAVTHDGVTFPKFDRHNGDSAKKRAQATQRKQRSRAGKSPAAAPSSQPAQPPLPGVAAGTPGPSSASRTQRDKSGTREEKRRDKENTHSSTSNTVAHADDAVCVGLPAIAPQVGPELAYRAQQAAQALAAVGINVAEGHPTLHAQLVAGVTVDELVAAAGIAVGKGKGFEYMLGVIHNRRTVAPVLANVTHESRNQAGHLWDDSRSVVEGQGERLGIGRWDELAMHWPVYRAKVRAAFDAESVPQREVA